MEELIGTIKLFAGTYCPEGYIYCDGQRLSINGNQALYAVIGSQYGFYDPTSFSIPNLNKTPVVEGSNMKYIMCVNGVFPPRQ